MQKETRAMQARNVTILGLEAQISQQSHASDLAKFENCYSYTLWPHWGV